MRHTLSALLPICATAVYLLIGCSDMKTVSHRHNIPKAADAHAAQLECGADDDIGHSDVRLMSLEEYDRSIQDLLFLSDKASALAVIEAQPKGPTGFMNDTKNTPLTPLLIEKYWTASKLISEKVLATRNITDSPYQKLFGCVANREKIDDSCLDGIVKDLGLRAYRRPITNDEKTRLKQLALSASTLTDGLSSLIIALIMSPNFLFISVPKPDSTNQFSLNPYQIITRLSYFIWGTMPDQELFSQAQSGKINLDQQVERMLKDQKSDYIITRIVDDWIGLDALASMITPNISPDLKTAMMSETRSFVTDLVKNDLSLNNLTNAQYTFLNQTLKAHYSIEDSQSDNQVLQKTDISGTKRLGVLSHASFLLATAGSTSETRPVKRGKIIARDWLCREIPPPPPGVPLLDLGALPPNATPRMVLAVHTQSPSCAGCHQSLDPLGLGFEEFDSYGRWRNHYDALGGSPIESSGSLGSGVNFANTEELLKILADSNEVKTCMAKKVLELSLQRVGRSKSELCVSHVIGKAYLDKTSKFSDLVKAIVSTKQFQMQRSESP